MALPRSDRAAIPERLMAVALGQPSWGNARKSVNRPVPIRRARHEQFTSYPLSVRNIRRSSVNTRSSVIRLSRASDCGGVTAMRNQECRRTPARDIPDEPEPTPSDGEL